MMPGANMGTARTLLGIESGLPSYLEFMCPHHDFSISSADKSMSRVGENEGRLAVQLACPALLTSQSRPPPGRVSSQPLPGEREASDCSASFCIQVDEPPGRPFLLLTRNSPSRKSSECDQGN